MAAKGNVRRRIAISGILVLVLALALLGLAASGPTTPLAAPGGTLVVLSRAAAQVELVDPASGETLARVPIGADPGAVAVSPDGAALYVTNAGGDGTGTVSVIDVAKRAPRGAFELVGYRRPRGVAVSGDGAKLWVAVERPNAALELDAATGQVLHAWRIDQIGARDVVATSDEAGLFVSQAHSSSVFLVERARGPVRRIATARGPEGLARSPDGGELWVACRSGGTIAVVDTGTGRVAATIPVPDGPSRLHFRPGSDEVWVATAEGPGVRVFDPASRAPLASIDLETADAGEPDGAGRGPPDLVFSPDGRLVFVTRPALDAVFVVDATARAVVRRLTTGRDPVDLAWIP